jgi:hypothetical protein
MAASYRLGTKSVGGIGYLIVAGVPWMAMTRGYAAWLVVPVVAVASLLAVTGANAQSAAQVGSAGVTINLPTGWHAIPLALPPGLHVDANPVARIVAASRPVSFGNGCGVGAYSFSRTAVALVLMEWTRPTPGVFPHRPARFTPKTLPVRPPPSIECFNGPGGGVEFTDHGRRFEAFLLLGRDAPAGLADRARAVLDTLRVRKPRA